MTASHPINAWRNRIVGLVLAVAIYAIDRYVKWLVEGPLELRFEGHHMDLLPFFDLTRTHNHGVSLGAFPATSPEMRWILVAVTGLIALIVFVWLMREKLLAEIAGLALILGSALQRAGEAAQGIRSAVGDPGTFTVDKGTTTQAIVAAPEGDGQDARAVIPG